jgi:hypothetical protein
VRLKHQARFLSKANDTVLGAPGCSGGGPLLIHLHNDKAGGASLTAALTDIVGVDRAIDTRFQPEKTAHLLSSSEKGAVRLYAGHRSYGVHKQFEQTPLYICSVREPVSRFASYLAYVRRTPDHASHQLLEGLSPAEAYDVQHRRNAGIAANGQTRHIMASKFDPDVSDVDLQELVEQRILMISPIEMIGDMINAFRHVLGLPKSDAPKVNVRTGAAPHIAEAVRTRILADNQADVRLCALAQRMYLIWLERALKKLASHREQLVLGGAVGAEVAHG